jgi:hypothetical protein
LRTFEWRWFWSDLLSLWFDRKQLVQWYSFPEIFSVNFFQTLLEGLATTGLLSRSKTVPTEITTLSQKTSHGHLMQQSMVLHRMILQGFLRQRTGSVELIATKQLRKLGLLVDSSLIHQMTSNSKFG